MTLFLYALFPFIWLGVQLGNLVMLACMGIWWVIRSFIRLAIGIKIE